MTTKITVDAHAGWPVSVKSFRTVKPVDGGPTPPAEMQASGVVPAGETRDFYFWDGCYLVVEELPRDVQGTV